MPVRIAVLDDHPLILEGVPVLLAQFREPVEWAGGFSSLSALQEAFAREIPEVLLLDLNLGNGADGVDICRVLHESWPPLRIIILTSLDQTAIIRAVMRNGAAGFLVKNASWQEMEEAVQTVMAGKEYFQPCIRDLLLNEALQRPTANNAYLPRLTRREKEVLQLIVDEHTTAEIAALLCISENTVETHRNNLLTKLGARNVAGLVKTALERGLLG